MTLSLHNVGLTALVLVMMRFVELVEVLVLMWLFLVITWIL
jgi:hypothetical protein